MNGYWANRRGFLNLLAGTVGQSNGKIYQKTLGFSWLKDDAFQFISIVIQILSVIICKFIRF